jgi:hypothetical protein
MCRIGHALGGTDCGHCPPAVAAWSGACAWRMCIGTAAEPRRHHRTGTGERRRGISAGRCDLSESRRGRHRLRRSQPEAGAECPGSRKRRNGSDFRPAGSNGGACSRSSYEGRGAAAGGRDGVSPVERRGSDGEQSRRVQHGTARSERLQRCWISAVHGGTG